MVSNENDAQVNNAILTLVHRGRGHGPLGKKMILPKPQGESELALRPHKDPPPGYGQPEEAAPYYDSKGKEPVTKEKTSFSEKRSAAEEASVAEKKAAVAAESAPVVTKEALGPPKTRPIPFSHPKRIGPTSSQILHAKCKKTMVKTKQEVEQGTKLADYEIAQRADAHFIKKNLKLRYFHECSEEHVNECENLVSQGMSVDEARAAHPNFRAWMSVETERERASSLEAKVEIRTF